MKHTIRAGIPAALIAGSVLTLTTGNRCQRHTSGRIDSHRDGHLHDAGGG